MMSTEVASLILRVNSLEARAATDDLRKLGEQGQKTESLMGKLGKTFAGLGAGYAIGKFIGAVIKNTIEAEAAQAQLEARLKSTGHAAGLTAAQLNNLATTLSNVTVFDDESIINAESMLLTFTKIGKDVFPAATEAVLNLSTVMGNDLQGAAVQLGKALNDPVRGVAALSKAGVQFDTDQRAMIKNLVRTGDVAGAQTIILKELETQMGNAARAARNTLGGSLAGLKNSFDNLLEADSGVPGVTSSINTLTDTLNDPEAKRGFQAVVGGILSVAGAIAETIGFIGNYILRLKEALNLNSKVVSGQTLTTTSDTNARLAQIGTRKAAIKDGLKQGVGRKATFGGGGGEDKEYQQWRLENKKAYDANTELAYLTGVRIRTVRQYTAAVKNEQKAAEAAKFTGLGELGDLPTDPGGAPKKDKKASDGAKQAADEAARKLASLRESLYTEEEAIKASYKEREDIIASSNLAEADKKSLSTRSLAQYDEELADLRKAKGAELEEIRMSLRSQEEVIQESYDKRKKIIEANTEAGSALRLELQGKLQVEYDLDLAAYAQAQADKLSQITDGYLTEDEEMVKHHERQREMILEATFKTEEMRQEYLRREEERFNQERAARERDRQSAILNTASDVFGSLADLASTYAKGQGKNAKKAFELQKAASIAQTVVKTYEAATGAYASLSSIPVVGPALGIAAAAAAVIAGLANVRQIQSQQFTEHDQGGRIPAGKIGIVGEYGPEFVRGPAAITGRQLTNSMLSGAGGGANINMSTVFNISDTGTSSTSAGDKESNVREFKRLVDDRFRDLVNQEQRAGGSLWRMRHG